MGENALVGEFLCAMGPIKTGHGQEMATKLWMNKNSGLPGCDVM
jgi:hypothetical protein